MAEYKPGLEKDRRKGPDLLVRSISWFGVGGWLLLIVALFILDKAKPDQNIEIFTKYNHTLQTAWDMDWARWIFYSMIFGLALSIFGIIVNSSRNRRRDDNIRISLIFLGIISVVGIITYIFVF